MNHRRIIIGGCIALLFGVLLSLRFPQLAILPAAAFGCIVLLLLFVDYPFYALMGVLATRVLLDRFSEWGISLGGFNLNLSALLALAIIAVTPFMINLYRKRFTELTAITIFVGFVLLGCASVLYGTFPQAALGDAIRFLSYASILILSLIIVTPEQYRKFIAIFPFLLLIPSGIAVVQLLTGNGFYDFGRLKPIGTFFHPNYLGYGSLIALIVVCINLIHWYRQRNFAARRKVPIIGYALFGFLLLFLIAKTHSLGAIFALILLIGLVIMQTIDKRLIIVGVIGLLLAALFPWYNYKLQQQGFSIVNHPTFRMIIGESQEDGSFLWRVRNWQSMFTYVIQKPALGWGLGSYKPLREEQAEYETDLLALEAHNDYMNFVVELGIVGASLLMLALLHLTFASSRTTQLQSSTISHAPLFISSLLLATMIAMSVENIFKGAAVMWPLFALVGATIAQSRNTESRIENRE